MCDSEQTVKRIATTCISCLLILFVCPGFKGLPDEFVSGLYDLDLARFACGRAGPKSHLACLVVVVVILRLAGGGWLIYCSACPYRRPDRAITIAVH